MRGKQKKRVLEVLFSHHLGWVKMEAQVVMAVLILSWAKLFQQESTALPHCWRGCLSTIFPFVSSRSNPTLYFHFYLPVSSRSDSKIHLCALSLSYSEPTALSPLCLCGLSLFPSFYLSSPSSPLDRHQFSLSFNFFPFNKGFQAWQRPFSCMWCFNGHVGCRWRMFGYVGLESCVNRATVCLHHRFISTHYSMYCCITAL